MSDLPSETELWAKNHNQALYQSILDQKADYARRTELITELLQICERQMHSDTPLDTALEIVAQVAARLGYADRQQEAKHRSPSARRPISGALRRAVWDRDSWTCQHCEVHTNLTVDHIVPVVRGGSNEMSNLQTLCGSCNSSKGDR